jgi:tetratricopeptide (TPR) repeat protein
MVYFLIFCFFITSSCLKRNHLDQGNQMKIDSLICIAEDSMTNNVPFGRHQVEIAMALVKDSLQYYEVLNAKAYSFLRVDSMDTAHMLIKRVVNYCQGLPPSSRVYFLLSKVNNARGIFFSRVEKHDSSIYYLKKAYDQGRLSGNLKALPDICINIADSYMKKSDFANSALFFRRALFISDSLRITNRMGFPIYFGLGQVYMQLRDFTLSDFYFRLAETSFDKRNLNEKFVFANNRGNYYYYKEEYARALPWFVKARALVLPKNYKFLINLCELNLSDIYLHLNRLDSAQYYSDRCYSYFSAINYRSALYYLKTIKAGIALKQDNRTLARSLLNNDTDTSGIEKDMIYIRNKCLQDYYTQVGDFEKAYQYMLSNTQISNSIQSERVRGRVAELDMRYKQDTTLLKRNLVIQTQNTRLEHLRMSKYLWILFSIIFLIVSVFVYLYMRKQHDLLRIRHMDQVVKLRMQNIRNRISPHFIFNILNHEINAGGPSKEKTGLPELVKFLRRSLELSENLSVTLGQELEFVQTYIGLEQNSLDAKINLLWNMDEQVGYMEFSVPAMIVQIPVENAIKHALRGKEGEKKLCVSVTKLGSGVRIIIQDNGTGYHPGLSGKGGTGTGLKVIYQTINLLNAKNVEQILFSISNVSDPGTTGTKVLIDIPEKYKYEL